MLSSPGQAVPSRDFASRLRHEIDYHRAAVARQPDPALRRQTSRDFVKACECLIRIAGQRYSPLRLSPEAVMPAIAGLLSMTGMEQLLRTGSLSPPGSPCIGTDRDGLERLREEERAAAMGIALEIATLEARVSIAIQSGPLLLQRLLGEIKKPVERMLAVELRSKGGRQRDVVRWHVILEAKAEYERLSGLKATKNITGGFVAFCDAVFEALGLGTTAGLSDLIGEVLYRPNRKKKPKKAVSPT